MELVRETIHPSLTPPHLKVSVEIMHWHLEYQKSCLTTQVTLSKPQRFYQYWIKYNNLSMSLPSLFTERFIPVLLSSCPKCRRAVLWFQVATSWNMRNSVKEEKHSGFRVHSEFDSVSEADFYVTRDSSFHSFFVYYLFCPFSVQVSMIQMPGSPIHRGHFSVCWPACQHLCFCFFKV